MQVSVENNAEMMSCIWMNLIDTAAGRPAGDAALLDIAGTFGARSTERAAVMLIDVRFVASNFETRTAVTTRAPSGSSSVTPSSAADIGALGRVEMPRGPVAALLQILK